MARGRKKSVKVSEPSVIPGNEIFDEKKKLNHKVHMGYGFRLGFLSLFFCLSIFAAIFLLVTSFTFQDEEYINYSEKSNLDYKVLLKPNDYYETTTLDKNMIYVASLIDSVDTYFKYYFNIDSNINMKFTYDVIAKLEITDEQGNNAYLTKEYPLIESKEVLLENGTSAVIDEKINIDYGYYNNIATGFKSTYSVNAKSNLIVTLKINKSTNDETKTILNTISVQQIRIPLSERAVNIKMDYNDIDNKSIIVSDKNLLINSNIRLAIGALCSLIGIYFAIKVIRLFEKSSPKTSKYDKYVNKLLRTYDRLIVESKNSIKFDDKEVIKVNNFEELLDVRDNLKLPINYYVITPHQKANFYIISTNIYVYTIKETDLEK